MIIFDSNNIFYSLKNFFIAEKKFIFFSFIFSLIISIPISIFFENKKLITGFIDYEYISKPDLFTQEVISSSSFNIFIKSNFEEFKDLNLNFDFPKFHFKIKNEKEIENIKKSTELILIDYIKFIKERLKKRLDFIVKENLDFKDNNYTNYKYTLESLDNKKLFFNYELNIKKPDHLITTIVKIMIFLLMVIIFFRVSYLIFNKNIKIK